MAENKSLMTKIGNRIFGAPTVEQKSVTTAETAPRSTWGRPQPKQWSKVKATAASFDKSIWAYAAVRRKMDAVSSANWSTWERDSSGEWFENPNAPLTQLIQRPNPFMTKKTMMERLVANLDLGGNELWSKIRSSRIVNGRGVVVELWPIEQDGIKVVPSATELISYYEAQTGNGRQKIVPDDMVHFMYTDPNNPRWGKSPLLAAAQTIDMDIEAVRWNKVSLQNRAVADGAWIFDEPLSVEQWNEARQIIRNQHQGLRNAHEPWVVGGGAKWEQFSMSPVEMDFINSQKMNRESIAAVFGVPPPIIGIFENATLANIDTARRIFWIDSIIPLLDDIADSLNQSLVPEFGDPENMQLRFDVSHVDVINADFGEKVKTAESLWKMGVPFDTVNTRLKLGFGAIPNGTASFLPNNVSPSSLIAGVDGDDFGTTNDL